MWFCFLAFMITMYVVLDGFDLGVGALHLLLGRNEDDREQATAAIGPVWNGNEVWLIAAGGMLFMSSRRCTPRRSAASTSASSSRSGCSSAVASGSSSGTRSTTRSGAGVRRRVRLSSAGLAFVFGVALGNVVRGVPLGPDGYFPLALFDILNWYAVLIGVFGLVVLSTHGAGFLAFRRTASWPTARAGGREPGLAGGALFVALIGPTYAVREEMLKNLVDHPWRLAFPALAVRRGPHRLSARGQWARAFVASSLFIVGLLTTMAAGLYPNLLPAREGAPDS